MNNLNLSLPNIQFLNVCHYLSTFSIFFASIDLITIDDQNRSIPVINALFEYVGKAANESEAEYQLLQKVLMEFIMTREENKILDTKYVNETYQYIMATLFKNERITRYAIKMNQTGNVKSSFQKLLQIRFQNLLESHIPNVCSTRNGSMKLSPISIGKIPFYSLPSIQRTGISKDESQFSLKRFRRMSPEDIDINSITQYEIIRAVESLLHEAAPVQTGAELSPEILENFKERNDLPPDVESKLVNIGDLSNSLNSNEENKFEFVNDTLNEEVGVEELVNEELNSPKLQIQESHESRETLQETPGAVTITTKKHKFYHDTNIPVKVRRIDNENNNPSMNLNLADEDSILSDKSINYQRQNPTNNNRKSKRLQHIENAAKYLSLCLSNMTLNDAENILKGYLLKLKKSTIPVPTYDDFAYDYCHNPEKLANYDDWKIRKHEFIEDVLFETYFHQKGTFMDVIMKMKPALLTNVKKVVLEDFKIYENSTILQHSLRVQDFLLIKMALQKQINIKGTIVKKKINAAFYRLALRECEEDWVENNITLFGVQNGQWLKYHKSNGSNYKFNYLVEFSQDREKEESKLVEPHSKQVKPLKYEIEYENLAGIVSVDRIFGDITIERFVIPLDTILPVISSYYEIINNITTLVFNMRDKRSKEKKMIDMVTKLYDILTDPSDNFSAHYN